MVAPSTRTRHFARFLSKPTHCLVLSFVGKGTLISFLLIINIICIYNTYMYIYHKQHLSLSCSS